MKCPYCGFDSKSHLCERCHAMIPVAKDEEPKKEEPVSTRRKHKEMKEHGT